MYINICVYKYIDICIYKYIDIYKYILYIMNINKNKQNEICVCVKLYYNKRDIELGEGFYPCLYIDKVRESKNYESDKYICEINVMFDLIKDCSGKNMWRQINFNSIIGFEDDNGKDILNYLNLNSLKYGCYIINSGGRIVHPTTQNTTFRILNNLK